MKKEKKKKRRRLKISGLIIIILFFAFLAYGIYFIIFTPIKSVTISGNNYITEGEILKILDIKNDTSFFRFSTLKAKKNIKKLDLIKNVKVKKGALTLSVEITEKKIVFYDNIDNHLILEDSSKINDDIKYIGYPVLTNFVPKDIYEKLIKALLKVDNNILLMISEIEYNPDTYNDNILDKERFLFKMNDGNYIYINLVNIKKINKYLNIYSSLKEKGYLYLDSSNDTFIFKTKKEEIKKEEDNKEESDVNEN